jgi:hypothetical protein
MVLGHVVPTLTPKPCRHRVEKCRRYTENNRSKPSRNQPCIAKRILKTHCPKPKYQWNITDDKAELSVAASIFSATRLTVSCCTQLYTSLSSSSECRHRVRPNAGLTQHRGMYVRSIYSVELDQISPYITLPRVLLFPTHDWARINRSIRSY